MAAAFAPHDGAAVVPISDHLPARRFGMRCPHCCTPGDIRSSEEHAVTLRKLYFNCRNPSCGHTWVASLVYDYGLSPSAIPNPALDLPLRPVSRAAVLRAMADAATKPDPSQPGLFDPTHSAPAQPMEPHP